MTSYDKISRIMERNQWVDSRLRAISCFDCEERRTATREILEAAREKFPQI